MTFFLVFFYGLVSIKTQIMNIHDTELMRRCEQGFVLGVKASLKGLANVNVVCPDNRMTPLRTAICHNKPEVVRVLLAHPTIRIHEKGYPLLHLACKLERVECVSLLLESRADPFGLDDENNTVFHTLCYSVRSEAFVLVIFETLIRRGAGPCLFLSNSSNKTPLDLPLCSPLKHAMSRAVLELRKHYQTSIEAVLPVRVLAKLVVSFI